MDSGGFIPVRSFQGAKPGYVFTKGERGVGYYIDRLNQNVNGTVNGKPGKRPRDDGKEPPAKSQKTGQKSDKGKGPASPVNLDDVSLEDLDEETIAKLLEKADEVEVTELDPQNLRALITSLDKKIKANQHLRIKHPDNPANFLESEVDLDDAIKSLSILSTAPELYPQMVELGTITLLLGLLTHENTDISIAAVALLQDLTDSDVITETEEAICVVDALVDAHGLELLVQNLARLDETHEEDARGVSLTLGVIDNLLEVRPVLGVTLCEKTVALAWLLKRVRPKNFDENKLYASEILSVLLNSDTLIQRRVGDMAGLQGMDQLLQACAQYRRRDPTTKEEEECLENIFSALAASLLVPENQVRFREGEGFELMVRCLREKKHAAQCAVKVLDYAITNNSTNCTHMVDAGGLKAVFPLFMGRAAAKRLRKSKRLTKQGVQSLDEHCVSIIASLATLLEDKPGHDCLSRLMAKFLESNMEKIDRLMELYVEYGKRVSEFEIRAAEEAAKKEQEEDSDEEEEEHRDVALEVLAHGGFTLQRLAIIMVTIAAHSPTCAARCTAKLNQYSVSLEGVRMLLKAYIDALPRGSSGGGVDQANSKNLRKKLLALMPEEDTQETDSDKGKKPG